MRRGVEPTPSAISIITSARITPSGGLTGPPPVVFATVEGVEQRLFDYYPDEISFTPDEFVGLTVEQAHELRHEKDVAYLRS